MIIAVQCPSCHKLEDTDGKWIKIKSVNSQLPFQYHKVCPDCIKETQKCTYHS